MAQHLPRCVALVRGAFWYCDRGPHVSSRRGRHHRNATTAGGIPVVLKFSQDRAALAQEVEALRAFPQRTVVEVIDFNPDFGAVVLAQAIPGTPLSAVADDDLVHDDVSP